MSWLGVLLIGLATTDLVFSVRRHAWWPQLVGAAVVVAFVPLAGLTRPVDVVVVLLAAGIVVGWGTAVGRGFGRGPAWLPLLVLGLGQAAALVASPWAPAAGGPLASWLDAGPLPVLGASDGDRLLLVAGVLLFQLSSGNVVVRLVLVATGTLDAIRGHQVTPTPLKGGRLLGPMERLVIVGLGLAGELTAAGIVVAAKGLLRFPELQSARHGGGPAGIHEVTEYFLLGSFVSWLVALGGLTLLAVP